MPIYAYKCESCGYARDVLQKLSDAPLTDCPHCGAPSFRKQLTAAGFQLKGSGWYVTDFRDGNSGSAPAKPDAAAAPDSGGSTDVKAPSGGSATATPVAAPAAAAATPAASGTPSPKMP